MKLTKKNIKAGQKVTGILCGKAFEGIIAYGNSAYPEYYPGKYYFILQNGEDYQGNKHSYILANKEDWKNAENIEIIEENKEKQEKQEKQIKELAKKVVHLEHALSVANKSLGQAGLIGVLSADSVSFQESSSFYAKVREVIKGSDNE